MEVDERMSMVVDPCRVVELRQYTLHPERRDELIDLFDRAFTESQEAVGMTVIGQFRDLDRADRFVWLRGFPDMEQRRRSLEAFYDGPVWKEHRDAANATMVDSDDVLLLRPATATSGFAALPPRPPIGEHAPAGIVLVTICVLVEPASPDAVDAASAIAEAVFVDDPSPNTFPRLPVRSGEHVLVWCQRAEADVEAALRTSADIVTQCVTGLARPPEYLRLLPTTRSRLR